MSTTFKTHQFQINQGISEDLVTKKSLLKGSQIMLKFFACLFLILFCPDSTFSLKMPGLNISFLMILL